MIGKSSHVRRNSEGSPGVVSPPGIQVSQPTPLPTNDKEFFTDKPIDANLQIPTVTQLQKKKNNRSRSSSTTSNFLNDIRENPNLQKIPLINKIRSRHSADLSENERSSVENSSVNGSVSSSVNSKKNNDFHSLFKSVPEEDTLVEDYGCALQKDILLQGRIYISEKHLCFNANIFGWVTNLVIPLADIKEIEKKSTAIFIPNAIQVSTEDTKYFFASFLSRDTAYELMTDTWRTACPDFGHSKGGDSLSYDESDDTSYDSGSYYDSDTEDSSDDDPSVGITDPTTREGQSTPVQKETLPTVLAKEKPDKRRLFESPKSSMLLSNNSDAANKMASLAQAAEVAADTAVGNKPKETIQVHEKTECSCNSDHYPNVVMNQVYPGTIESIYNLLFKDDFLRDFLTQNQKATDVVIGSWKNDKEVDTMREMSYIKPLNNPLGPKSTKCLITEEVLFYDLTKSVSVLTTTNTPDVPSGNSFSVKTRTCLTFSGKDEVKVFVSVLVDFTKSSWLKSTIEKASIDGQVSYYKELDNVLRSQLNNKSGKPEHSNRRKRKSRHTAVHKALATASRILADVITAVINAFCSPKSSHSMLLCLFVVILANIFIAHKMAYVEKQLHELSGSLSSNREKQSHDTDEVWNMIKKMQDDDDATISPEGDPLTWQDALATSQIMKDRLERQIHYLNEMIQKAENDVDQVSQSLNEQQQKTKDS
ncbi:hypothetical protein K501DRAFT_247618 [Backusella circina FSU 941]|nr:hypothetical protein K501DRAFT_247618 [Backusella circina FSU 941]